MSAVCAGAQSRKVRYSTTTTVLVEEEPNGLDAAELSDPAAKRPRPTKDGGGQLIGNLILSAGFVMPCEPTDEMIALPETITSATPQPLPKGTESVAETPDEVDSRPRGVFAVEYPEEVLFTKGFDISPERLEDWAPEPVTTDRRVSDEDA